MEKVAKEKVWHWTKRLIVYLIGMFLVAVGINIAIKSNLGISPVSSIPYVLSLRFTSLTLGNWTTIVYCVFVLIQLAILGKEFKWYYVFQFAVSTVFGFFVDGAGLLTNLIPTPEHYVVRVLFVFISMLFIALGIMLYLDANVMSMPGEGVTVAMTKRTKWQLSTCKMIFDVTLVTIAITLSLVFFHQLAGVREGTVLIAFGVGIVMKPLMKFLKKPIHTWVHGKEE